jgi:hypothetical protein
VASTVRWSHVALVLIAGAIVGFSIFGVLAWRAITTEQADLPEALRRFETIRASLGSASPAIEVGPDGTVMRRAEPAHTVPVRLSRLNALAYQPADRRLIEAKVPFWFFRLKAPAAQYAVRGTGLDLKRLGLTAADLERYGPRVILDQTTAAGNRLLVWTE